MRSNQAVKLAALLLLASSVAISAKQKHRDWQIGTVLDSTRSRYFAGTIGSGHTRGTVNDDGQFEGTTSSSETATYRVYQNFVIEGDQFVYLAQEHLKWRWSKAADLTVNGKVKYAIEKRNLYVVDDGGKEHKMEIIRKALRQPPPQSK